MFGVLIGLMSNFKTSPWALENCYGHFKDQNNELIYQIIIARLIDLNIILSTAQFIVHLSKAHNAGIATTQQ